MVDMLTEKLLHFISTDIYGMLTRFRAKGRETGYDKEEWNVVPHRQGAHVTYLITRAVSVQLTWRRPMWKFWTQQALWPSTLSPPPQPSALCPNNLPVSGYSTWVVKLLSAASRCGNMFSSRDVYYILLFFFLHFTFKEYLPITSLLTYASEFLHHLLLF